MTVATQCAVPQRNHQATRAERAARSLGTALVRWAETRETRQFTHEQQQLRVVAEAGRQQREHAARRLQYFS